MAFYVLKTLLWTHETGLLEFNKESKIALTICHIFRDEKTKPKTVRLHRISNSQDLDLLVNAHFFLHQEKLKIHILKPSLISACTSRDRYWMVHCSNSC